jgi:hypothetical protein
MSDRIPVPGEIWTHKQWGDIVTIVAVTGEIVTYNDGGNPAARILANFCRLFAPPARPIPPTPADREALYFIYDENGLRWGQSWEPTGTLLDRNDVLRVPLKWGEAGWVTAGSRQPGQQ